MNFYILIYALLIFLVLAGLWGLFFFKDYIKKISCLSVSYSSFMVLITILSLKNLHFNQVLVVMVSILVIFSVNLLIGIGIARAITEAREKAQSQALKEEA
jgi:hypothetical protein